MSRSALSATLLGCALLLLAPSTLAMGKGGKGGKTDVQACLVRPDDAPDADAKGRVRLRLMTKKGEPRTRLDVRVMKVDTGLDHELHLEDAPGSESFDLLGSLEVSDGDLVWSMDTGAGDDLPGGAESADDLVGRRVEVRVGGEVVLAGVVPALDLSKKPVKEALKLAPPDPEAPASAMKARLKLRSKAAKGQHRLALKARKVPFGDSDFHVFLETDVASDVFEDVGPLEQKGSSAKGRYRRDCWQGQALPMDAADLASLAGRRLQIRDDEDAVHLEAMLPAMD
jgi:hypothetical protein